MNRKVARQLTEAYLKEILSDDKARILKIFNRTEYAYPVRDLVEYELTARAYYEDSEKKQIRIVVAIDEMRFFCFSGTCNKRNTDKCRRCKSL